MATATLSKQQWPFAPQSVNNCLLWLDAADTSSYTSSASISTWRNKGYAGGTATTTSGTVGSTSADINGLPAFSFGTNAYMTMSSMTFAQTTRTAFVVVNIGASGTVRRFICSTGSNTIDSYILTTGTDLQFNYNGNFNYITTAPYPIFNTTSIICGTTLSTNGGIFVNGLAQTPYSTNTPAAFGIGATTTQTIGFSATDTFVLGEVMIFDGAITDIQRQQVEGYLAQKWGLQSFLPPTHPYFTLNNLLTNAFTPTEIPTCTLWLDASDATSVVGTGVATWKDKSGNGNNATGVNAPVFVQRTGGVSFTAASAQYFTMGVTYSKTNTIFMVATPVPSNASGMYYTNTNPTNSGDNFIGGFSSSYLVYYIGTNSVQQTSYVSGVPTSPFIAAAVKTTGVSSVGYYNGDQVFSITDNTSDVASTWAFLGAAASGANYLTATVYEFIIYNVALTANQVQAVNAYLGAKWNIAEAGQGSIAPVVNPLAISGCQLWLDGADQTSIVPVVSQWNDKSGNAYNLAVGSGTTTYVNYGPGPSIKLNSSYLFINKAVNLQSYTLFVVSLCQTAVTNQTLFASRPNAATTSYNATDALDLFLDSDVGNQRTRFYADTVAINNSIAATTIAQPLNLMSYTCTAAGVGSSWVNGVVGATASGAARGTTGQGFGLGADWETTAWGNIQCIANTYEIIVYNSVLTTTQRQQVENYLMAKWGVGRNFWIDASDATTITTGTTVTKWLDKSGNGNNVSQTTSSQCPVYTQNVVNGLSIVRFNYSNSTNLQTSSFTSLGTQGVTFFLVERNMSDSAGSGGGPFSFNSGPNSGIVIQNNGGLQPFTGIPFNSSTARIDCYYRQNTSGTGTSYTYVNGTSVVCQDTTTGTYGTTFAVGERLVGNLYISGDICEIIIYAANITTTQRQQIETYLGNKWGITVATSVPGITNPTLVPGCILWLDAADTTTIVTAVSQINDKSGNGYNVTQSTATYQPTITNNYLRLGTASNYYMNMPQAAINNASSWTLFLVFNPISTNNWIMVKQYDLINTYNILSMGYSQIGTSGTAGVVYFKALNAGTLFTGPSALTTSTNQLLTMIYNGTNIYYYINGVLALITNGTFTIQNVTNATNATIGVFIASGVIQNSGVTNFQLGELDFYRSALPTAQIQQIEAYLMNKWSITNTVQTANGSLVDTPFLPTDITGCAAWYDGADTSSITMTGTAITSWADKSGNSKTATAFNSPTYSISGLGVTMNGTNNYFTTTVTVSTSTHCLIAAHNPTTVTGNGVGNDSLFRFQQASGTFIVFPYMNGTIPRGYINSQDGTTTGSGTSVLVENAVAGKFNIVAANIAATSQNIYKNGVLQSTGAGSLTNVTSDVMGIGSYVQLYEWYQGTIYEMIVYNTTLTTAQFQAVTNYLQRKWNTALTVTTIPTPVYNRPFQPVDIAGCQLWLDSADNTALALSGSNVTTWYDKSGNGNNGTATGTPVLTANSINGYQSIYLADAPYFLGSVSISTSTLTCFAVATTNVTMPNGRGRDQRLVSLENLTNVDYGRIDGTIALFNQATTSTIATWRVTGPLANNAITTSTPFIAVSQYNGANAFLWYTGTAGTSTGGGSTGNFGITKYGIGNQANPTTEYWNGYIGEVIIYNTALSTSQRQQVEAYLSWKWGFVTGTPSLPSTHPGKTLPSFSTVFNPKSISGISLWLDAYDITTLFTNTTLTTPVTASGQVVRGWADKSGNGLNNTTTDTVITYNTTTLGIPAISFPGTQAAGFACALSMGSAGVSNATYFLVVRSTIAGNGGVYLYHSGSKIRQIYANANLTYMDYNAITGINGSINVTNLTNVVTRQDTASTGFLAGWDTGNSFGSVTLSGAANSNQTSLTLGGALTGYFCEIIVYNSVLSTAQRQQVEGYLAWKWGAASLLPTSHSYKKNAP